jgi:hypothetical protein
MKPTEATIFVWVSIRYAGFLVLTPGAEALPYRHLRSKASHDGRMSG